MSNPGQLPGIIFDCDGVLVDSETTYLAEELQFLGRHGVSVEPLTYMRDFMGRPPVEWNAAIAQLLRAAGVEGALEPLLAQHDQDKRDALHAGLEPVAGMRELLAQLPQKVCVASSSAPDALQWKLTTTGLALYFGAGVYSSAEVARGKPEPDLFLHAAARSGMRPAHCVVVEDSANGVLAGKRAGMRVIGFTAAGHCPPGHEGVLREAGADHLAASAAELLALLKPDG